MMQRWLVLSLALLVAGCSGSSAPPSIYVGHVATLSGPDKAAGDQAARAIRLAVKEQNNLAADNKTRPIVVRHTDTKGNLDAFEAEAVRLISVNRVVALLGGDGADEVARMEKAQAAVVSASPRTPGCSELVFFTGLSWIFQGQVLARFAVQDLEATKLAVLIDERKENGLALAGAFARELHAATLKKNPKAAADVVTWRFNREPPVADWAKRLAQDKRQAVLFIGASRDLIKVRQGLPFSGPILFGGADGAGRELLDSREATGVYLVTAFAGDVDLPRAKEFTASYRQAFSEDPDVHAALAYDAARLLFEAIAQCPPGLGPDGISKEVPKQLIKLKDFAGLTGPLAFTADRQLLRPAFVVRVENNGLKQLRRFPPDG
jgi:branched-chain amino acid transport system substrate-binding protein